jgi:hypothetical protein
MFNNAKAQVLPANARQRKLLAGPMAAAFIGAAILTYAAGPALFAPAPPMLGRAARAATIVLVAAAYLVFLVGIAAGIRRIPAQWPRSATALGILFVAGAGGAVLPLAPLIVFLLVHVVCYTARACAALPLPEQILYTISVATRYPFIEALAVLALLVCVAVMSREPAARAAPPSLS